MVLEFKVYVLARLKRRNRDYLVLRDAAGRFKKFASTDEEKKKLEKWYKRWNIRQRLEDLISNVELKAAILRAKQKVRKLGFNEQISLYGILNTGSKRMQYRRYEIFKNKPFTQEDIDILYNYFYRTPPAAIAGVYIYLPEIQKLVEVCLLHEKKEKRLKQLGIA
jgi:hypothetical protein